MSDLNAICAACGLTFGAHRGDGIISNQCPQHEGWMDWPTTSVTTFRDSGRIPNPRGVPSGTPSLRLEGMNAPDKIWAVSYYTDEHDGRITAHFHAASASAAKDICRREREDCARIVRVVEVPR